MKKMINVLDYAGKIWEETEKGVLLTTKVGDKVNTMTIGWGTMGMEWRKRIYTVFVRESRLTKKMLDENPEFTINIPYGEYDKSILSICGTRSGRDMDKIKELGLTLEAPEEISVPGIKEFPLTLECRVIYRQEQDPNAVNEENTIRFYPRSPEFPEGDYHTAYYGQIVAAYIIE